LKGLVTAIRREPGGGPPRVAVFVDGRQAFTLPEDALAKLGLEVGSGLGEEEREQLDEASASLKAREAALRLLAVRARTRSELVGRLRRRGFDAAVIGTVVDGLQAAGLIDDRAFAELWADERMRLRPVGRRRLSQELRVKGVPPHVADEVLERAYGDNPEHELALRVARARARRSAGGAKARERLYALLLRRGFTRATAADVVREVMGEGRDE
jgi:regulatory protein